MRVVRHWSQVYQRSIGCHIIGDFHGQVGSGFEQPGPGGDVPACGREVGTMWSLNPAILRFCGFDNFDMKKSPFMMQELMKFPSYLTFFHINVSFCISQTKDNIELLLDFLSNESVYAICQNIIIEGYSGNLANQFTFLSFVNLFQILNQVIPCFRNPTCHLLSFLFLKFSSKCSWLIRPENVSLPF